MVRRIFLCGCEGAAHGFMKWQVQRCCAKTSNGEASHLLPAKPLNRVRRDGVAGGDRKAPLLTISGDNDEGVPPVPIPNTEVKPFSAESTWLDTAREDRSSPDFFIPQ